MPVTSLFSAFRARGWGKQSEQQVDVAFLDASSSTTAVITPAAPYAGMIVHFITVHRLLPNAFTVEVNQREVGAHSVTVSSDLTEVSFWAWVDNQNPLIINVTNRLAFAGFVGLTLATLNFDTLEEMYEVRRRAAAEFGIEAKGLTPAPNREEVVPLPGPQSPVLPRTERAWPDWRTF